MVKLLGMRWGLVSWMQSVLVLELELQEELPMAILHLGMCVKVSFPNLNSKLLHRIPIGPFDLCRQ